MVYIRNGLFKKIITNSTGELFYSFFTFVHTLSKTSAIEKRNLFEKHQKQVSLTFFWTFWRNYRRRSCSCLNRPAFPWRKLPSSRRIRRCSFLLRCIRGSCRRWAARRSGSPRLFCKRCCLVCLASCRSPSVLWCARGNQAPVH